MKFINNKKGVAETLQSWLIPIILGIVIVIIAVSISLSAGQKTTESFSAKVFSTVNLESIPLPEFIKSKFTTEKRLEAIMIIEPESPVCAFETLKFSCLGSYLPKGIEFSDVSCIWDVDASVDSDGDSQKDNDADSKGLVVETAAASNRLAGTEVKLRVIITGDVEGSGTYKDVTSTIKNTIGCASSEPLPSLLGSIGNGGSINLRIPRTANVEDVHIFVDSGKENVQKLNVVVADDVTSAYTLAKEFTGNHTIFDQNLATRVNAQLSACTADYCIIPIKFYTDKTLKIVDVKIPYNPKPIF
jgi:hypothetical protein